MPIVGASDVATGASAAGASATAPVQDPIAASNVAAGASAAAPRPGTHRCFRRSRRLINRRRISHRPRLGPRLVPHRLGPV
jgi:hypothetical protein